MTIVVGAASPDGIVLAADGRTTAEYPDSDRHRIATDSAEKLFDLDGRFAAATYGTASVGLQTINGVMNEFIASHAGECEHVEHCAQAVGQFFTERFNETFPGFKPEQGGWPLGFVVAGYDDVGVGHIWEVNVPGPRLAEQETVSTRVGGFLWRGQMDVVTRLIKGRDIHALAAGGAQFPDDVNETLNKLEYIVMAPRTVRDAADLAAFLVRTTIDMQRFSDGTVVSPGSLPGCGGDIQLLAATRDGTQWLRRRDGMTPPGVAEGAVRHL